VPEIVPNFSALAPNYDAVLCDVWGVVHNGVVAFPQACDALMRARAAGIAVVFITNAPRPHNVVARQSAALGVPAEASDAIVSSGDVTRALVQQRQGQSLFHMGPKRDVEIFTGLDVTFAPLESADYVVCSGLDDDDRDTPEDYRARLEQMLARKVFMICGNPDVVVERGDRIVYCAGAVADLYAGMGGEVVYAGKPYAPIYEMALAKAETAAGHTLSRTRVLAIGDSIRTDFTGAHKFGIDFLFVTSGIHAEELGGRDSPDRGALKAKFAAAGATPAAVMRELVW
jgi:HAD superfamily hydrolase (TIGR01459 family)